MLIKPPDYCTGVLKAGHHERLLWNVQFYLENKKQNCEAWNMIRATNMNFKTWRMRLLVRKPVSICCDYHLPHAVWNITGCWWNERVFYPNILKVGWIWGFCSPLQNSALSSVLKFTDLNFLHWWIIHLSVCLSVCPGSIPEECRQCHTQADCVPGVGCQCKTGFQGNGTFCSPEPRECSAAQDDLSAGAFLSAWW